MPAAMEYIRADDNRRWSAFENSYNAERTERQKKMADVERYYEGKHAPSLLPDDEGVDDNIVINHVKQIIDRSVSFLFPTLPKFEINAERETQEEQWLKEAWRYNKGTLALNGFAMNGCKGGHVFIKIKPAETASEYPRLINLKPDTVTVFWQADDIEMPLWYEIRYEAGDVEYLQDIVYDRQNRVWIFYEYESRKRGTKNWVLRGEPETWKYPFAPIVHWQHLPNVNEFYGKSETDDGILQANDAVNRIASDINRILRYHSFPKTVGTGFTAGEMQETGIDRFWTVASPDAVIKNLEMQSDLSSSMNMLTTLTDNILSLARVVIMKGTVKDFQRVTNTGIRAVFLDMINKNILLRWSYGVGLAELSYRMLAVAGKTAKRPDIIWPDPLPEDQTETVNILAIERAMKIVSHRTAATKRGYSFDQEARNMEQEASMDIFAAPEPAASANTSGGYLTKQDSNEVKR